MYARSNNGVMLNKNAVILCLLAGLTCLYLVYSWMSSKSNSTLSGTQLKRHSTWKINDFVDIPADVLESAKKAEVVENRLTLTVVDESVDIFYRILDSQMHTKSSSSVLFLHGAGSSSEIWQQLGTMQLVAAMGYKAVAVDLPGWAKSAGSKMKKERSSEFLSVLIKALKLDRPVIVSASMSGMFSVPYMMTPDPTTCQERLRGYVPLAPVATNHFLAAEYHRCEIPTMIVYGTKDKDLGLTSVGYLRNMPLSEIMPMEGAGHAGYQERPDEWHRLLYNFLLAIRLQHEVIEPDLNAH